MIKIKTPIDMLFKYIEEHSPVKESKIPNQIKKFESFENHLKILENNGMIEVKLPFLSSQRVFVFKSDKREMSVEPWDLKPLNF